LDEAKHIQPGESGGLFTLLEAARVPQVWALVKDTNSLSLALTLLLLQQVPRGLWPVSADGRRLPAQNFLNQAQQQFAALAADIFTLGAPLPHYATKAALDLLLASDSLVRRLGLEGENKYLWREMQNKLEAFYWFEHFDSALGIVPQDEPALSQLIERARALGPYRSVWAIEGLGHHGTNIALQSNVLPKGLLQKGATRGLPESSLLPLHAGMGLSLAEFLLRRSTNCKEIVDCFVQSCVTNSDDCYVEVAYESLGLACRNLNPQLADPIHAHLSQRGHELLPYFWHGLGRAIYFSPLNLLPGGSAPWAGIQMCVNEAPNELAKQNALAGFAWAMTLVNIRDPEVIQLLLQYHGRNMPDPEAFMNGVYSSAIAWRDSSPEDSSPAALGRYQPNSSTEGLVDLWNHYVAGPCRQGLTDYQALHDAKRIGAIFRV
jgi:hypothetical protein